MRRTARALTIAVVVIGGLAPAPPAQAKCAEAKVTVTGPGLDRPIVLGRRASFRWWAGAGVFRSKKPTPEAGPGADLGLAYGVLGRFVCGDEVVVRQVLYPYADGGPQVFTPEGQRGWEGAVEAGYRAVPDAVAALLTRHGLPEEPARRVAPEEDASHGPWKLQLGAGLALLGPLLAAGVAIHRRRRPSAGEATGASSRSSRGRSPSP